MKVDSRYLGIMAICLMLPIKTARAFFPIADFGEIIPGFSEIKSEIDAFKQIKDQVTSVKDTLKSIGSEVSSIAKYGPKTENIKKSMKTATQNITTTTEINIQIAQKVEKILDKVNAVHENLIDRAVAQTNSTLNIKNSPVDVVFNFRNGANETLVIAYNESFNFSEAIEEEEEEEEIDDTRLENEIKAIFSNIRTKNGNIHGQINDMLEASLYNLNEITEITNSQFNKVAQLLDEEKGKIDENQKAVLVERLNVLIEKEDNVSEQGIKLIEELKQNYKKQYKEKIVDGTDNYEKVVIAYTKGEATKQEVGQFGENLRKEAKNLSFVSNLETMKNYETNLKELQKEAQILMSDIEGAIVKDKI